jgi:hypothetical protein
MAFPAILIGEVAELLARAYVLASSRGRLTTFEPDADVDHKDFIVDRIGTLTSRSSAPPVCVKNKFGALRAIFHIRFRQALACSICLRHARIAASSYVRQYRAP